MGSVICYFNNVNVETPEVKYLTVMMDKQDGPSKDTWKKMATLMTRVPDNHDSCAGRTIVLMTVRHRCPSKETWKKL